MTKKIYEKNKVQPFRKKLLQHNDVSIWHEKKKNEPKIPARSRFNRMGHLRHTVQFCTYILIMRHIVECVFVLYVWKIRLNLENQ